MVWDNQDDHDNLKKGPWGAKKPSDQNKQNPWGQNKGNNNGQGQEGEEPDLEEFLRQAQGRLNGIFGKNKGGSPVGAPDGKGIGLLFLLIVGLWLATGFYRILPEENGVITTFGKWTNTRTASGLGYHIPWPVQQVQKVNVAFERRLEIGGARDGGSDLSESRILTGDENIVDTNFVVTWRISDAKQYLFNIRDPETTVKKVAESAMREIIGQSVIQKVLTEGRANIESRTKETMQKMLDDYHAGIAINNAQLLRVAPPSPVVDAFDDVQRARADKERLKNEAQTYSNKVVPVARGDAQKLLAEANAYREAVISKAKGEAERFNSVYQAYAVSKDITMERIYIETMQQVMQSSRKIIVGDGKASPLLPYLPLDVPGGATGQPTIGQKE